MRKLFLIGSTILLATAAAHASGNHEGGHGEAMSVGEPGNAANADRTINVTMRETDDGEMVFEPSALDLKKGETVRFKVANKGQLEHEFILDDSESIMEHKEAMQKMPDMEHDDPNALRLDPGADGEVVWKFTNAGKFEFACLVPGHYESGMKGDLTVTESQAKN